MVCWSFMLHGNTPRRLLMFAPLPVAWNIPSFTCPRFHSLPNQNPVPIPRTAASFMLRFADVLHSIQLLSFWWMCELFSPWALYAKTSSLLRVGFCLLVWKWKCFTVFAHCLTKCLSITVLYGSRYTVVGCERLTVMQLFYLHSIRPCVFCPPLLPSLPRSWDNPGALTCCVPTLRKSLTVVASGFSS